MWHASLSIAKPPKSRMVEFRWRHQRILRPIFWHIATWHWKRHISKLGRMRSYGTQLGSWQTPRSKRVAAWRMQRRVVKLGKTVDFMLFPSCLLHVLMVERKKWCRHTPNLWFRTFKILLAVFCWSKTETNNQYYHVIDIDLLSIWNSKIIDSRHFKAPSGQDEFLVLGAIGSYRSAFVRCWSAPSTRAKLLVWRTAPQTVLCITYIYLPASSWGQCWHVSPI